VWDWFVDAVEMDRIHATLSDFPVDDPLRLAPSDLVSKRELASIPPSGKADRRYSPGFLLPLIFGALEDTGTNGNTWQSESYQLDQRKDDVQVAKRLCEKGCLALAIASLSSECDNVRRLSVTVLGQFSSLLQRDEARQVASWRERPQIVMLIRSLQKAMILRKSTAGGSLEIVEKLPGLSALFLARSCLILLQPSDAMFSPVNRFFLRMEADHGAFQDLTRLPGFISLFCSNADDLYQVREERMWAIRLVRDGFVGEDCYRPVVACHAVELLLSTVDSLSRLSPSPERETSLILEALSRIVRRGGEECDQNIAGRLGLLPWFRSILTGRTRQAVLADMHSREAFLELVAASLGQASKVLPSSDAKAACECLAQPVLDLCVETTDASVALISFADKVLCCIDQMGQSLMKASDSARKTSTGVSLTSASLFLAINRTSSSKTAVLLALCRLPLRRRSVKEEEPGWSDFCQQALSIVANQSEATEHDLCTVLGRVNLILSMTRKEDEELESVLKLAMQNKIVEQLLSLSKRCALYSESREALQECMQLIVSLSEHATCFKDVIQELIDALLDEA
jgi:hypothetical protein